jgi:hypothetical protein
MGKIVIINLLCHSLILGNFITNTVNKRDIITCISVFLHLNYETKVLTVMVINSTNFNQTNNHL